MEAYVDREKFCTDEIFSDPCILVSSQAFSRTGVDFARFLLKTPNSYRDDFGLYPNL